jgi:DNA-directed RNA polymerase specialized sigma24 family protein
MTDASPLGRDDLERLYQRFGTMILRRARRILGDEQLAHDVCHDVFVQALRADPWAPPSPLGWFYVATTNACLNLLRGERRRRVALQHMPRAEVGPAPTEAALLFRRVPPELQEISLYCAVEQLSQDEIAVLLGVSQKTISNRIRTLRAILDPPETTAKEIR